MLRPVYDHEASTDPVCGQEVCAMNHQHIEDDLQGFHFQIIPGGLNLVHEKAERLSCSVLRRVRKSTVVRFVLHRSLPGR